MCGDLKVNTTFVDASFRRELDDVLQELPLEATSFALAQTMRLKLNPPFDCPSGDRKVIQLSV
jgi:hypothetical protein